MKKKPVSAAATARLLSRLLKENGFQRANTKHRFRWTEGFYVNRSGSTVRVDYNVHYSVHDPEATRMRKESQIAQMRECLFELSYVSSHPKAIYIECLNP